VNILDAIPAIGSILDKTITTKEELEEIKLKFAEIDIREVEARLGVQKAWLDNKSVFVSGAIPMMLWMVSIVILFNCVISPLLAPVWEMPVIDLPEWYSSLAATIVIGLFGKKAFDGNTIQMGNFLKPAKGNDLLPASEVSATPIVAVTAETRNEKKNAGTKNKLTDEEVSSKFEELTSKHGAGRQR
jgi:hypothetical protein